MDAWRRPRSSPPAHRGGRVIGTDALRILVISQESSAGEESNQDNKDNPNIDAHQSARCSCFVPTYAALDARFGKSKEPRHLSSVCHACHHGRTVHKSAFEEVARGWLLLAEQTEWIEGRRSSLREEHTSN